HDTTITDQGHRQISQRLALEDIGGTEPAERGDRIGAGKFNGAINAEADESIAYAWCTTTRAGRTGEVWPESLGAHLQKVIGALAVDQFKIGRSTGLIW